MTEIIGTDGDDTLTSEGSGDTLKGGAGDDLYIIDLGNASSEEPSYYNIFDDAGGNDSLEITGSNITLDDIRFTGRSSTLYINTFDENADLIGQTAIWLNFANSNLHIETLIVGDDTIDLTQASSGADLNGLLYYGATDGDDLIIGDEYGGGIGGLDGDDTIRLGATDDEYSVYATGGNGDDLLETGSDSQSLYGGDGNDTLTVAGHDDAHLEGGDGSDTYVVDWTTGSEAGDLIFTEIFDKGTDSSTNTLDISAIAASKDNVLFSGGYGLNIYIIDDNGTQIGTIDISGQFSGNSGWRIDTLIVGDDTLDLSSATSGDDLNSLYSLDTTILDDSLSSDEDSDTLYGFSGDDTIRVGGNNAEAYGGLDDDLIIGSEGSSQYLDGGFGNDTLQIEGNNATAYGYFDNDVYRISWDGANANNVFTTILTDLIVPTATYQEGGYNIIDLTDVADDLSNISFSAGLDAFDVNIAVADNNGNVIGNINLTDFNPLFSPVQFDLIRIGNQTFDLTQSTTHAGLNAALAAVVSNDPDNLAGTTSADALYGYGDNDTISGEGGNDTLDGGNGNDILNGGTGSDRLYGGTHNDNVSGGAGNDVLYGDHGADTLDGGDGTDVVQYLASGTGVTVNLSTGLGTSGQAAGDVLSNVENINGSRASDHLTGDDGDNKFVGYGGWDTLDGGAGDDRLEGWLGHDLIDGGAGNDVLMGGRHNDTLNGGAGDDTLSGGIHFDVFVFIAGTGDDVVTDFNTADDTLDLSATTTDFTDLASVEAATSEVDGGILIDLGGGDTLLLQGLTLSDLTNIDIAF